MKQILMLLVLAFVVSLAKADDWWGQLNEDACGKKCYAIIKKCYHCLDTRTCPPTYPTRVKRCDLDCMRALSSCLPKFPDCFDCECPNLERKEECPFEGATIENEECCREKASLGCSGFYCPGEGQPWECVDKCEDDSDCLCPNVKKEETCPGEGVFIQNKYCCKNEESDGCSAWKCPGQGEPWECAEKC